MTQALGLPEEALPCTAEIQAWGGSANVQVGDNRYLCLTYGGGPPGSATADELGQKLQLCDDLHGTGDAFARAYAGYVERQEARERDPVGE